MHRCIQIAEVQEHIVSFASVHTSAQLARTCRSFYAPATDAVWATLEGYAPLIKCMPSEVWTESGGGEEGAGLYRKITRAREPTAAEWRLFRKHAHRVKRFYNESRTPSTSTRLRVFQAVDTDALDAISRHVCNDFGQRGPLFPNLVELRTPFYTIRPNRVFLRCVPFLSGKTLLKFAPYEGRAWSPTGQMCLCKELAPMAELLLLFPLDLRVLDVSGKSAGSVNDFLIGWKNLREVKLTAPLDEELLVRLSQFTELEVANLTWNGGLFRRPGPLQFLRPCFTMLEDITLNLFRAPLVVSMFRALRGSRTLRRVRVGFGTDATTAEEVGDILRAVAMLPELEAYTCSWNNYITQSSCTTAILTGPLLAVLHPLRGLRRLRLVGLSRVRVEDEDIWKLGSSCPVLESIHLSEPRLRRAGDHSEGPALVTTLAGVAALRNACPRLCEIDIPIGRVVGPGMSRQIPSNVQLLCPLTLIVGHGSNPTDLDPTTVAMVIRILLPRLEQVVCPDLPSWSQVHEKMAWLVGGRFGGDSDTVDVSDM